LANSNHPHLTLLPVCAVFLSVPLSALTGGSVNEDSNLPSEEVVAYTYYTDEEEVVLCCQMHALSRAVKSSH